MLEVKHLVKTYSVKGKDSTVVHALNDVSLKFPDTGLIFILGKSGSGKSTLLNVMGGLDIPDSGEIIIKGKSSKDFKAGDFDSYRNTYLGFIFQEYNILDEFTVGKNISLAIELQGKKPDQKEIDSILDEVDLSGLNNRKPNELSGGQKQRVAIARALVKHPDIIFADEPTGALDSKTGKAVFDTLKKLSTNHLVVVVSHDRDFAEQFGDRVIELKDGQVISDIEKIKVESNSSNKGLNIIDDKVIQIKKGYQVTDDDIKEIVSKIKSNTDEKYIVMDDTVAPQIRKISNINEEGEREVFEKTDETKIKNKPEKFQLIKSKLGFKNSFKIGASALKVKPFRLFLTVLLAFASFSMFGVVASLASYNRYDALTDSIVDSKTPTLAFNKSVFQKEGHSFSQLRNCFSDSEVASLSSDSGLTFTGVSNAGNLGLRTTDNYLDTDQIKEIPYYQYACNISANICPSSNTLLTDNGFTMLSGKLPSKEDEIAITDSQLDVLKKTGYTYTNSLNVKTKIEGQSITESNILGNYISITDNSNLKITGVVNTGFVNNDFYSNRYKMLKTDLNEKDIPLSYNSRQSEFSSLLSTSYINVFFVNEDYYKSLVKDYSFSDFGSITGSLSLTDSSGNPFYSVSKVLPSDTTLEEMTYFGSKTSPTSDSDVLIPYYGLINYISLYSASYTDLFTEAKLTDLDNKAINTYFYGDDYTNVDTYTIDNVFNSSTIFPLYSYHHKDTIINNGFSPSVINQILKASYGATDDTYSSTADGKFKSVQDFLKAYEQYLNYYHAFHLLTNPYEPDFTYSKTDVSYLSLLLLVEYQKSNLLTLPDINLPLLYNNYNEKDLTKTYQRKVVGFNTGYKEALIINSSDTLKGVLTSGSFATDNLNKYDLVLAKMPTNKSEIKKLVDFYYKNYDGAVNFYDGNSNESTFYLMNGPVISSIQFTNSLFSNLSKILFYCALAVAVFTCLMLFNFIATSISYKRKEIGILRAVGARGNDVFNIFFNESLIIVIFDVILSIIATFVVCLVLNNFLRNDLGLVVTLLHPGIIQILLILGIGLLTAFISSFIPVMRAAKKKPIDAIHNK